MGFAMTENTEYEVVLQPSGHSFTVKPGEPVLVAGLRQHIGLPYGCRMGTCRSCRGRIVDGQIDHGNAHPSYLPQEQRDQGFALLCQARPETDLTIEIEELPPLPQPQKAQALLKRVGTLAPDVKWLNLRLPLHLNLRFAAGQYIDLFLPDGARRSYSIANQPKLDGIVDLELHIRHMPGGLFTDPLFDDAFKLRTMFDFEGPLGTFYLRESEKDAILLASGTGYAPIRSILLDAFAKGDKRHFILYWGGRQSSDIYAADEIAELVSLHGNFTFVPVVSDADPESGWTGRTGFVHRAVMEDYPEMSQIQVYACGTPLMVDAARAEFVADTGLPADEFFADSFVTEAERSS